MKNAQLNTASAQPIVIRDGSLLWRAMASRTVWYAARDAGETVPAGRTLWARTQKRAKEVRGGANVAFGI
jgi:hypothetical protein